jgi:hypothetical protein
LDHKPLRELLIEGVVRIVGCAGYKSGGKRELSPGNLFHFVVCELTSTHPAEYPVFVVVRHSFSFPVFLISFSKHTGNPLSKQNMDQEKTTEQGVLLQRNCFNMVVPKSRNGTRDGSPDFPRVAHLSPSELVRVGIFC